MFTTWVTSLFDCGASPVTSVGESTTRIVTDRNCKISDAVICPSEDDVPAARVVGRHHQERGNAEVTNTRRNFEGRPDQDLLVVKAHEVYSSTCIVEDAQSNMHTMYIRDMCKVHLIFSRWSAN